MARSFIITVDTEGDGLWEWHPGKEITTLNSEFVDRFQDFCDKFNFKSVYLTNYEMAQNDTFMEKVSKWQRDGRCEVGIHPHAWNNPPLIDLEGPFNGQPYLIEYPEEVMYEKFKNLYDLLTDKVGIPPVSHRAGRWAMNATYFNILKEFNIKVDCSHTPFISWVKSSGIIKGGPDYRHINFRPSIINGILEVPMTVRISRQFMEGSWKHRLKTLFKGQHIWLRPACETEQAMLWLINQVSREPNTDYLEFMIHSSELMPGGSPYNIKHEDVESFFRKINTIFTHVASLGYVGTTLREYYKSFKQL